MIYLIDAAQFTIIFSLLKILGNWWKITFLYKTDKQNLPNNKPVLLNECNTIKTITKETV